MKYHSTRNKDLKATAKEAIFKGPSDDGGLFVPERMPDFSYADFVEASYHDLAAEVLHTFFGDFSKEFLKESAKKAYEGFNAKDVVGYRALDNITVAELYHGPTSAFKDFALQMLPYLMVASAEGRRVRILTATSGDTGKAALEGFKDVQNTDIFVFYPANGVSSMQKLQMQTQEGNNVFVYGIEGNFDDAQRRVKELFQDQKLKEEAKEAGIAFSSANSINIGRLVPQVVYYIYSYLELVRRGRITLGEQIDVCVPTGNFGNLLASMYAKAMGLPIAHFICASNKNNVLTDFIQTGIYDTHREFYKTTSPSMDILVASNIERYLALILHRDYKVKGLMEDLKEKGRFEISKEMIQKSKLFGYWSTDAEGEARIREVFEATGYLMDPHTAVAYDGVKKHASNRHVLLMSTASPYKFPETVAEALNIGENQNERELLKAIEEKSKMPIPSNLIDVFSKEARFDKNITIEAMAEVVKEGFCD